MKALALQSIKSIERSAAGMDYPEKKVVQPARSEFWYAMEAYQPHFKRFFVRPEYSSLAKKVPESLKD